MEDERLHYARVNMWLALLVAGAIASAFITFVLMASEAGAHEAPSLWMYPANCCSGRDCSRVPMAQVSDGPEGYRVVLKPGDHNMAPNGGTYLIPYPLAKASGDHEFHICILPSGTVICFFYPPRGM